jgi:SAM-dependent methyltransferase
LIGALLKKIQFDSILDAGCGNGCAVQLLADAGKQAKGFDISPTAAELARSYGRDCIMGSILNIPFPEQSFDVVMSTDVMEHLKPEDVQKAIAECFRVGRKYLAMRIATRLSGPRQPFLDAGITEIDNPHLTVKSLKWWMKQFKQYAPCRIAATDKRKWFIVEIGSKPKFYDTWFGR